MTAVPRAHAPHGEVVYIEAHGRFSVQPSIELQRAADALLGPERTTPGPTPPCLSARRKMGTGACNWPAAGYSSFTTAARNARPQTFPDAQRKKNRAEQPGDG